ncbi:MAG TPA: NAD-dependent succinate-semialdehyde dehydrogenase [Gammaproteobacteria bacterium]|jgi:succinate-semialdehyde dehydrogenase/glutarate-semialdehyde dehydrogenase|nr:NAD-dependent succinate-semialdehyde dehydrogenase [Gammaproteobacteria bacterium]
MHGLANTHLFQEACYINGKWIEADSKQTIPVNNPYDGSIIGYVPRCGQLETQRAIAAADAAWQGWRERPAKERCDLLWAWAHLIDKNKEDLARLMTLEQGKPLKEALGEIDYANNFVKWFAEEGRRVYGDVIASNQRQQYFVVIKQPVGVVAAITPWNFPVAMITRKISPALAVGCTVVVKPAEETPFSALALAALAEEAGMPSGVLNVITGTPDVIGDELTANPSVRKLSFTGSTAVGRQLMAQCAPTIKKISLELGGNAPFIVFNDADLDAAVAGAMTSKFRNTGQTCVCANRFLIQDGIYTAFTEKLTAAVRQLKVGNGLEPGIQQGPLINEAALEKVLAHVADALTKGGRIQCGGKTHEAGDLFFQPTVITEANMEMRLAEEETFGPVAPLFRFHTEEEAVAMANNTEYGLASYFYTNDSKRVWRVGEALEYGMVAVNSGMVSSEVAPFGGVKQSGMGREGSKYGVDPYIEIKFLSIT